MTRQHIKAPPRGVPAVLDRTTFDYVTGEMTPKQRLYVQARTMGSPPVVAAKIAGFKKTDLAAMELEADDMIRQALDMAVRVRARERQITREVVLDWMMDALRNAATSTEQLAAAREIGKMLGFYEPAKVQINTTIEVRKQELMTKSDDELLAMAGDTIEGQFKLLDFERDESIPLPNTEAADDLFEPEDP